MTVPEIRRPDRELALQVATEAFAAGERVDMGPLSDRLGIGRSTLYRWVGDREQLLGEVVGRLTDVAWEQVEAEARGEGVDRAVDVVRRFMVLSSEFEPLRGFAEREAQLALRVLCSPDSPVPERIGTGIRRAFERHAPDMELSPELVDVLVQVGTALEWAPIVAGQPAPIDRAVRLLRWLVGMRGEPAA